MIFLTISKPKPLPSPAIFVVKNGSKYARESRPGSQPESVICTTTCVVAEKQQSQADLLRSTDTNRIMDKIRPDLI